MNSFNKCHLEPWGLEIVNKYPLIFTERTGEQSTYLQKIDANDYVSLRYGFEHGSGWSKLIEQLAEVGTELVTYLRSHGDNTAFIHGCICKEKFGTLRWQGDANLPKPFYTLWRAYIDRIENESANICELTGKPGQLCQKNGWFRTLSQEEAIKNGFTVYTKW